VLGMDPDLPTWDPEILAGMAAEEARLIAEAEHMQTLTPEPGFQDADFSADDLIDRLKAI
jgi:hypothetical protein